MKTQSQIASAKLYIFVEDLAPGIEVTAQMLIEKLTVNEYYAIFQTRKLVTIMRQMCEKGLLITDGKVFMKNDPL